MLQKLILLKDITKSIKRDKINKLCLWIREKHSCFISTHYPLSKLRYSPCSGIYTSTLCTIAQALKCLNILSMNAIRTQLHNINFITFSKAEI